MWRSSLFWRFFLSIMLVVLLTSVASRGFERYLREQHSDARIARSITRLIDFRDQLADALAVEDFAEARELLRENPHFKRQFLLFDTYDNEILGREKWRKRGFRGRFEHPLIAEFRDRNIALMTMVSSDDGNDFFIEINPTMDFSPLLSPRVAGGLLRWGLWVLLAAVVGYLLTRALTTQIRQLQRATHRLATGDFQGALPADYRFSHDELGQLGQDFQRMAQQLDTSQRARKQMLSDISHELRSPLARMQVALEIARTRLSQTPAADNHAQLNRIETEIERLNSLIGQIIHIQQLQLGDEPIALHKVDLSVLIRDIVDDVNYEYQQQQKYAIVTTTALSPDMVGTADLLRSALENVIRNAMSHTPTNHTVDISLAVDKSSVIITVRDYGRGIQDADKTRIFESFVRLDSSRNRETGGYGLGLAISKAIIENHGGNICADNHPDGGLIVIISLPIS